jgi:hypothetical protein
MTRAIFLILIFAISALAQNKVWTGKALGYKGEVAELYVGLDGFNDLETAVKVGMIESNGRFKFELPEVLPEEALTRPEIREDCGEVTAGLKLAVVSSVLVKTQAGIIGEMNHSNHASAFEDIQNQNLGQGTKLTAWFYANRNGILQEDCLDDNIRQLSNVKFQKGWNVLTAYYFQKGENLTVQIRNGYTEGLQRWYFVPQAPDPQMP